MWSRFSAKAALKICPKPRLCFSPRNRAPVLSIGPLHRLTPIRTYYANLSTTPPGNSPYQPSGDPTRLELSDSQRKTIYALSTPIGKAGIAVIRVSGPEALDVWHRMVRTTKERTEGNKVQPQPWRMRRCCIVHPENGETLDEGLALFFKGHYVIGSTINVDNLISRNQGQIPLQPKMSWNFTSTQAEPSSLLSLSLSLVCLFAGLQKQGSSLDDHSRVVALI
jgi:hypothetical protein